MNISVSVEDTSILHKAWIILPVFTWQLDNRYMTTGKKWQDITRWLDDIFELIYLNKIFVGWFIFYQIFFKSIHLTISIVPSNALALKRKQAISWSRVDQDMWLQMKALIHNKTRLSLGGMKWKADNLFHLKQDQHYINCMAFNRNSFAIGSFTWQNHTWLNTGLC